MFTLDKYFNLNSCYQCVSRKNKGSNVKELPKKPNLKEVLRVFVHTIYLSAQFNKNVSLETISL